jgi:hypothetical protein
MAAMRIWLSQLFSTNAVEDQGGRPALETFRHLFGDRFLRLLSRRTIQPTGEHSEVHFDPLFRTFPFIPVIYNLNIFRLLDRNS